MHNQAGEVAKQSTGFKDKTGGSAGNGSLIKIGTELANTRTKSSSEYTAQTAHQSSLNAGENLSIVAAGAEVWAAQDRFEVRGVEALREVERWLCQNHLRQSPPFRPSPPQPLRVEALR